MAWFERVQFPGFTGFLEIAFLATAIYFLLLFFRGTRGAQVLTGLVVLLVGLILLTRVFRLDALNWLLQRFTVYLTLAFVIIFQPEIRRALAELGKQHVFTVSASERSLVEAVVQATMILSERKIGALIAMERQIGTRAIQETGKQINGVVTPELLASVFFPHTPLHDGGVIIGKNRILAAGCVFPLTQREGLGRSLGTRHRAAMGLTEETDAVVVVISEETGTVSLSLNGRLRRGLDEAKLRRALTTLLHRSTQAKSRIERIRDELDIRPQALSASEASGSGKEAEPHAG